MSYACNLKLCLIQTSALAAWLELPPPTSHAHLEVSIQCAVRFAEAPRLLLFSFLHQRWAGRPRRPAQSPGRFSGQAPKARPEVTPPSYKVQVAHLGSDFFHAGGRYKHTRYGECSLACLLGNRTQVGSMGCDLRRCLGPYN